MITTETLSTRPSSVLTVKFSSIWRASSTRPRSRPLASASVTASFRAGAPDGLSANVVEALFTHFIREEDKTVRSLKLDEELARVSNIADEIVPRSMVLSNESFATTNEREGSEIGRQVVEALLGSAVKVLFVTHQFTLANTFYQKGDSTSLFLRAQRTAEGRRTFKLEQGKPLPTSFGEDIYRRIGDWTGKRLDGGREHFYAAGQCCPLGTGRRLSKWGPHDGRHPTGLGRGP